MTITRTTMARMTMTMTRIIMTMTVYEMAITFFGSNGMFRSDPSKTFD